MPPIRRGDRPDQYGPPGVSDVGRDDLGDLQAFVVQLGAGLSAAGEPVDVVQQQLARVASAYGAEGARISAFPTFMMVSMGRGEPAALEITTSFGTAPGLDQIAALDRLVREAERGEVPPTEGLQRLDEIASMTARYAVMPTILGYSAFTVGLCLILQPAPRDVAAAAVLGALVGLLRWLVRRSSSLQVVLPVLAAFLVSALERAGRRARPHRARAARHGRRRWSSSSPGPPSRRPCSSWPPGRRCPGASRLVAGIVQLALLAFGIVAGIEAVGVPFALMLRGSGERARVRGRRGSVCWCSPIGVVVANSAPGRSFPSLLIVLYVAWAGQVVGNVLLGASLSAFVGALVMTPVATWVSRLPHALPPARVLPARLLAAGPGRPRPHRAHPGRRRRRQRRRPGARQHRRLDLRRRGRGALRHPAARLGQCHGSSHRRALRHGR